jgi:tRNA(fMet)-specific endonuclease VapC
MSQTSTSFLLDTSVLVLSLQPDAGIRARMATATTLFIPSVALGEWCYGAQHSAQPDVSLAKVEDLASSTTILPADAATARIFGRIKHQRRVKGLMLPNNDLWIAATAIHYGLAQEQWKPHEGGAHETTSAMVAIEVPPWASVTTRVTV